MVNRIVAQKFHSLTVDEVTTSCQQAFSRGFWHFRLFGQFAGCEKRETFACFFLVSSPTCNWASYASPSWVSCKLTAIHDFPSICNEISISIDCKQGYKFKTRFRQFFCGGSVLEVWETSVYVGNYANIQNFYEGEKQKENTTVICMKFFILFSSNRVIFNLFMQSRDVFWL